MLTAPSIETLPYITAHKLPLYWQDDQSRVLYDAVWAYICHCAEPEKEPAPGQEQLILVAKYCRYYVNAPCWDHPLFAGKLAALRGRIEEIAAAEVVDLAALKRWIHDCLEIAVDPL